MGWRSCINKKNFLNIAVKTVSNVQNRKEQMNSRNDC